jgi:hypothetical protein
MNACSHCAGPDDEISSDAIRGAIQPIISTGMATPSQIFVIR